jgi:23S rRNA (uracil1939-C5)-methyltransferase
VSRGARFDAIIVNPPRRGTSPAVRELVARLGAECIVYVSCDPETLARDLDHLSRGGYLAASIKPLDMIPLTDEVESVACVRKGPPPPPLVVYEDDDVIFVDKAAHEPIESHAYYTGSLLGRVRALPGAERSISLTHLDPGASGVVAFARSPDRAALWRAALASPATRMIHLAAARGIMPTKGNIARELPGEALARTRYRRIAIVGGHSIVRAVPEQQQMHQILRHFAAIGHAIIGDDRHGHAPTNRFFEERHGLDRTFLHCSRIEVAHPVTARRIAIEAPIAGDLRMVLERANGSTTLRWLDDKARTDDHRSSAARDQSSRPARGGRGEIDSAAASTPAAEADRDDEPV